MTYKKQKLIDKFSLVEIWKNQLRDVFVLVLKAKLMIKKSRAEGVSHAFRMSGVIDRAELRP